MKFDLLGSNPILDALPEPILFVQEGRVAYHNRAAASLLPELAVSRRCPQQLSFALPEHGTEGIAVCMVAGKSYRVTSTVIPAGIVMVLRPARESDEISGSWMPAFTEQLREQMTGLLAATQRLEGDLREKYDDQYDKWLAVLNQNAYRLLRLAGVAELRHNLTVGDAYHQGTLDLVELCHGLELEVAPLAKQMELTFIYEAQIKSLVSTGDPALLRYMLLSLISNAMKAIRRGGTLGLRLSRRNDRAVFTVWDDGPGMDERSLGTLFQEEHAKTLPRPGEGLRIGLFNARTIASLHDGVLMVESKQGEGARFTVSLPINTPEGLSLHTPKPLFDGHGGFSPLLVELSDALPWQMFLPTELE